MNSQTYSVKYGQTETRKFTSLGIIGAQAGDRNQIHRAKYSCCQQGRAQWQQSNPSPPGFAAHILPLANWGQLYVRFVVLLGFRGRLSLVLMSAFECKAEVEE